MHLYTAKINKKHLGALQSHLSSQRYTKYLIRKTQTGVNSKPRASFGDIFSSYANYYLVTRRVHSQSTDILTLSVCVRGYARHSFFGGMRKSICECVHYDVRPLKLRRNILFKG